MARCSYNVFVRREGWRWRWTVLYVTDGRLGDEWTGRAWSERRADHKARMATKRHRLSLRASAR